MVIYIQVCLESRGAHCDIQQWMWSNWGVHSKNMFRILVWIYSAQIWNGQRQDEDPLRATCRKWDTQVNAHQMPIELSSQKQAANKTHFKCTHRGHDKSNQRPLKHVSSIQELANLLELYMQFVSSSYFQKGLVFNIHSSNVT